MATWSSSIKGKELGLPRSFLNDYSKRHNLKVRITRDEGELIEFTVEGATDEIREFQRIFEGFGGFGSDL